MVGRIRLCIVPDCKDITSPRYRFPTKFADTDIYKIWMERINNPQLFYMTRDQIQRLAPVCGLHFEDDCKVPSRGQYNKLKHRSVPTLHLPNYPPEVTADGHNVAAARVAKYFSAAIDLPAPGKSDPQLVDEDDILLNVDPYTAQLDTVPDSMKPAVGNKSTVSKPKRKFQGEPIGQVFTKYNVYRKFGSLSARGEGINKDDPRPVPSANLQPLVLLSRLDLPHIAEPEPEVATVTSVSDETEESVEAKLESMFEDITDAATVEIETEPEPTEVVSEVFESEVVDESICEFMDAEVEVKTDVVDHPVCETNQTEAQPSSLEKPYFKSVMTYVLDSNCLTEVCRICFRSITGEGNIKLYGESLDKGADKIKNMLRFVLPHLDLELYPNTVFCSKCIELLMYSYQLKETWLMTEEKLQKIVTKKIGVTNRDADLVIVTKVADKVDTNTEFVVSENVDFMSNDTITVQQKSVLRNLIGSENTSQTSCDTEAPVLAPNQQPHEEVIYADNADFLQYPKPRTDLKCGRRKFDSNRACGPHMCDICGAFIVSLDSLKRHVKKHNVPPAKKTKVKDTMCEICGQFCKDTSKLHMHYKKHIKHECETCHKIFKLNSTLQKHIKLRHLGLGPSSQCHLCGKKLARNSWHAHMLVHYPQKKHECNICSKKFKTPSALRNHLRSHTNTTFECKHCGKTTKYQHSLDRHIKIYHENRGENVCEFCSRPYWKKVDLNKHRIKVHGWGQELQEKQEPKTED